ncbi:MAG: amino acid adenylation domain-containing protein, partial [Coriobacteriales bacterium]|nr:amino acid adenylation domain-containing protein [Coriobacteriales bacterium]
MSNEASNDTQNGARVGFYPLNPEQMGIYYAAMQVPEETYYNLPYLYKFDKDANGVCVDADRLADSLRTLIAAHPYLMCNLVQKDGQIMAVKEEGRAPQVELLDVSEREAQDLIANFVKPFNLFKAPLYRAQVLRTAERVYLLFDVHHVIFDGTSLGLLQAELGRIYDGGQPKAERKDSFEHGLEAQGKRDSDAWEQGREYYKQLLGDGESATALHEGRNGDAQNAQFQIEIGRKKIFAAAEALAVSPATYLGAIFALTLGKYEQTRDVRIGWAYLGRDTPDTFDTYGMMVRTLPYRVELDSGQTVSDYVKHAQAAFYDTISASIFSLVDVKEAFDFLPSVVFNYVGEMVGTMELGGLTPEITSLYDARESIFPFAVTVYVNNERINLDCAYDSGHIESDLAAAFMQSFAYLAEHLADADNLDARIANVCVLSDEQAIQLSKINHRFYEDEQIDMAKTVPACFANVVKDHADKTALICEDGTYTYGELDAESNKVANRLAGLGDGRPGIDIDEPAALMLPRTSRVPICEIGIMKAGGAFIPIDPSYPKERVEHIMNDSGTKRLFVCKDTMEQARGLNVSKDVEIIDVDDVLGTGSADGVLGSKAMANQAAMDGHSLAYIIYTSGSTGVPKGVQLEHHGLLNYVTPTLANKQFVAYKESDIIYASIFTVAFDASIKEIYGMLLNGLTLALATSEQCRNPIEFARFVKENKCTALGATPSVARSLLTSADVRDALCDCEYMWIGAEKFPEPLFDALKNAAPHMQIINSYGPTECTIEVNTKFMHRADESSIGAPINRCIEQIMDLDGNPVPVGVFGELYIGGDCVGRGYVNRPELNEQSYCKIDDVRYFKSGDIGRMYANGEVDVIGRNDSQVKFHGLRIELGEIESACMSYEPVTAAVVQIAPVLGVDQICAWFTATEKVNLIDLKMHMAKQLTPYMMPAAFLQLDDMPLTANGKLDKRALPAAIMLKEGEYEAPEGQVESDVCDAFAQTLGVTQVGRKDSFFAIGGDSLSATEVLVKLDEKGYKVTYADVFSNPTPAGLAEVASKRVDKGGNAAPGIPSASVNEADTSGEAETADGSGEPGGSSALKGAVAPAVARVAEPKDAEVEAYDYSVINELLALNTSDKLVHETRRPLGNICLTGSTGYLGAHLLHEFLQDYTGVAYLPIRADDDAAATERVNAMLEFYFAGEHKDLIGSRIIPIAGSITSDALYKHLRKFPIDTYINSAALVKHFSASKDIEEVNVNGTKAGLEFAKNNGCAFIQVSTMSVAGVSINGTPDPNTQFSEQMLYFGQDLSNQYARSKFLAERAVLEAAAQGVSAKVLRVNNLMPRMSDGKFQKNYDT